LDGEPVSQVVPFSSILDQIEKSALLKAMVAWLNLAVLND
jgi:hypothetical protein